MVDRGLKRMRSVSALCVPHTVKFREGLTPEGLRGVLRAVIHIAEAANEASC